jgi:hypothetical protein
MAKVIALWVRSPDEKGCQYRGVFSQKKKLQEGIIEACGFKGDNPEKAVAANCDISEDFTEKIIPYTYAGLCKQIKLTGRVFCVDKDGEPLFQAIESEMNAVRKWDIGEDGELVVNPVA